MILKINIGTPKPNYITIGSLESKIYIGTPAPTRLVFDRLGLTGVKNSAGIASGEGGAQAVSAATKLSSGMASGVGAAIGASSVAEVIDAVGSASGAGAAAAAGDALKPAAGTSAGVGAAAAVGASQADADGAASGVGSAAGAGAFTTLGAGIGTASGVGAAAGVGAPIGSGLGAAAGVGAASGTSTVNTDAVGTAAGTGSAAGIALSLSAATGTAAGTGTASAVGSSLTEEEEMPGGRLTLSSGTPVMTSTVSGATTIYYTPYVNQKVQLYDGSSFTNTDFGGELSQATTDSTKSPAAATTNSNYDLFVWNDSSTIRCTRGPAWTSSTARGTGAGTTELVRVNGILLNANNITNGPAAQRGTYVGTVRSNGSSQIDYIFGALAANGTAAFFGVWNAYNRVDVNTFVADSTNSWTYGSATPHSSNGSDTRRISFVTGLQEDSFDFTTCVYAQGSGTGAPVCGLGVDVTNAFSGVINEGFISVTTAPFFATYTGSFLGFHFIQDCEASTGATTVTFYGDANAPTILQTGMFGRLRM